jgi:signal transduction histidine kinase
MPMRICLVSVSEEVFTPLKELQLPITIVRSKPAIFEADLYIWDYTPGLALQSHLAMRASAQHLILSDPKHLDDISDLQTAACILLKPVTPFTLKAFAELACRSWQLRQTANQVDQLRSDRDTLLQYVLEVNLKLQEYDQERNNFLARALHDFRAPLTALHGYCGLLCEGKLGRLSDAQLDLLERMRNSTRRLTRLAGGTLDLLLEGRFKKPLKRVPADIEATLRHAINDVYPLVRERHIDLRLDVQPPQDPLLFEPEQMQQVIVNLLENSCKFTQRHGIIQIRAYPIHRKSDGDEEELASEFQTPNAYQVDVIDSGSGIPSHLAEKIFEQYSSYSGSNDRSGGGIGLAICRAVISAHGGSIWATPSEDGGRFSFVIPMDRVDAVLYSESCAGIRPEPQNAVY